MEVTASWLNRRQLTKVSRCSIAFIAIMFGFLLQWPTILTLVMFPVLVVMYVKLAKREEADSIERFGEAYLVYVNRTGRFFPKLKLEK